MEDKEQDSIFVGFARDKCPENHKLIIVALLSRLENRYIGIYTPPSTCETYYNDFMYIIGNIKDAEIKKIGRVERYRCLLTVYFLDEGILCDNRRILTFGTVDPYYYDGEKDCDERLYEIDLNKY